MASFPRRAFRLDRVLGLGLLGLFLAVAYVDPYPVQFLRLKTFDYYQRLKPRELPPPERKPVTIIDIDEESLAEIGQWPWPRTTLARLVDNLARMGAAQVAFDMVFAEPDRVNPALLAQSLPGLDEKARRALRALPSNDQVFADAIKRTRVVLGQAGYWRARGDQARPPVKKSVALLGPKPNRYLPRFQSLVRNVDVIEKAAAGHGIFSLVPEPDGIVRRVPTLFVYDGNLYPALAVEMLRVAVGRRTILVATDNLGVKALKITKRLQIPTDSKGRVWPYFSRRDGAKYVSARDVLAGTADPALIRGKLALVGTSAVGLRDIRETPVEPDVPGVEVHAQLIETALTGAYLKRPANIVGAEFLLVLVGGLLMIWLVPRVGAKWTMGLFLLLAGGAGAASWYLFSEQRVLFDVGLAVASSLLLYTLLTYAGYAKEEARRRQVREAFAHYLSPQMVEKLAENPARLKLGGETRDMTFLFCDVRGFTTISERLDAAGLTSLINELLTPLTNAVLEHEGTIDKYMGDCLMAFWNAPLDDPDHARHGCQAALAMVAEMEPLNRRLEGEGRTQGPLRVGIGINSGEAVVGNMGSEQRFDYSVLGDTVNAASRLEGQSKAYGVDIVIGESTRAQIPEMATVELDLIQVKGKTVALKVYALLGDERVAEGDAFGRLVAVHDDMLASYRYQEWDKARELLGQCRELGKSFGLDALYDLYAARIDHYEADPPGADWDGVFVATMK